MAEDRAANAQKKPLGRSSGVQSWAPWREQGVVAHAGITQAGVLYTLPMSTPPTKKWPEAYTHSQDLAQARAACLSSMLGGPREPNREVSGILDDGELPCQAGPGTGCEALACSQEQGPLSCHLTDVPGRKFYSHVWWAAGKPRTPGLCLSE